MKGLTYWLNQHMYIALTNRLNSVAAVALKGPNFIMPTSSNFTPLPNDWEPSSQDVIDAVDKAFDEGRIGVTSMSSEEITFAGLGEPLLCLDTLTEAAASIKESRHGVLLRVRTNGLVPSADSAEVAAKLRASGIKHVAVSLMADNPKQYADIVQPMGKEGFGDVCSFVIACVESGELLSSLCPCCCCLDADSASFVIRTEGDLRSSGQA